MNRQQNFVSGYDPELYSSDIEPILRGIDQGEVEASLARLDELISSYPNPLGLLNLKASLLRASGEYQPAMEILEKVLKTTPNHPGALTVLGDLYTDLGEDNRSLEAYLSAVKAGGETPGLLFRLGMTFKGMGCLAEAADMFSRCLAADPDHREAEREAGFVAQERNDPFKAMGHFRTYLAHRGSDWEVLCALGSCYLDLGWLEEGISYFHSLKKMKPLDPFPQYSLALAYWQKGWDAEAKDCLIEAFQLNPEPSLLEAMLDLAEDLFNGDQDDDGQFRALMVIGLAALLRTGRRRIPFHP